jgi:hypothetical protein
MYQASFFYMLYTMLSFNSYKSSITRSYEVGNTTIFVYVHVCVCVCAEDWIQGHKNVKNVLHHWAISLAQSSFCIWENRGLARLSNLTKELNLVPQKWNQVWNPHIRF